MPKKTGVLTTLDDNGNIVEMYPEVITDTTLSISGKPADAAAVGEALTNIQPGDNSVTLTQAEYDALSDEEKASNTTYYISDGDAQPNAFSIPFTSNKYNATTTGDALNEVKTGLEETNSNLLKCEIGFQTLKLNSGIGTIDFSNKYSSIIACIVEQNYDGYIVQYCKPVGSSIEFKISDLSGNTNSFSYGINFVVYGVPL